MTTVDGADAHEVADPCAGPDAVHELRLVAVHLDDGATIREHLCQRCGAVWFD